MNDRIKEIEAQVIGADAFRSITGVEPQITGAYDYLRYLLDVIAERDAEIERLRTKP